MSDLASASRREAFWIVVIWAVFAAWVVGHAAVHAYPEDPGATTLTFGLPSWVVWGIALPWVAASCVTIFFCLRVMEDTDG